MRHAALVALAALLIAGCGATRTETPTVTQPAPCKAGEARTSDGSCLPVQPTAEAAAATAEALRLRSIPRAIPRLAGVQHVSAHGVAFVAGFEGFSSCPYWDAYGHVATRGFGETDFGDTFGHRCITRAQGYANLRALLETRYCYAVRRIGGHFNQGEFDALCSASYNLGPGIIFRLAGSFRAHNCTPLLSYDHAGGVRLYGLTRRRRAECALFRSRPAPETRAHKRKRLYAAYTRRRALRRALTRHRCRTVHGRHAYRECPRLAREGRQVNRTIRHLRKEGVK